ncbi:MAG: hypothetical protein AB7P40_28790 [Chloroflexota bacterium]
MSFGTSDLRRGQDVFSADGVYLGAVVWVTTRPMNPPYATHEPAEVSRASSRLFSGEALGPMPTAALGNSGPARQNRAAAYSTHRVVPTHGRHSSPAELLVFRWLVALNWDTARPRLLRVPVSLVQNVSHERIVLTKSAADLA